MKVANAGARAAEAARILLALPRFTEVGAAAYRPGLERIRSLLDAMDQPHLRYPVVHVAGTNGKGSVASMLASITAAAGIRTGLHTSPHLQDITERMRVDGMPAPKSWLADNVLACRNTIDRIGPSFFEATVALSLKYFAERSAELAIVEVGLGGRLDATNVVAPALALITNIGMDHTEILGGTVEEIAREKAGIIKVGVPVLTSASDTAATEIRRIAAGLQSDFENVRATCSLHNPVFGLARSTALLVTPARRYDDLAVALPMRHQLWNAVLAVRAAERYGNLSGVAIDEEVIRCGLRDVRALSGLRGRFDVLDDEPLVIADVAHNGEGIATLFEHMNEHRRRGRLFVCMALMRDKQPQEIAAILSASGAEAITVDLASQRALPGSQLGSILKQGGVRVDNLKSVENARTWFRRNAARDDVLLFTGSHQVVAEALAAYAGTRDD